MSAYDDYTAKGRQQFACANGWYEAAKEFSFRALASGKMHTGGYRGDEHLGRRPLDHPEWFRKDRRPVAIVGHNYRGPDGEDNRDPAATAKRFGLTLHVAPAGDAASWYYPGATTLLVMTRPETTIIWPTAEEMAGMVVDHANHLERQRKLEIWRAKRRMTHDAP
jgi:hypothetical protein